MRKDLLERAKRLARRIPNRKATEPKEDTPERKAKFQKYERLARRIEKKHKADDNFDREIRLAIEYTRDIRDAQDCYNRLAGNYELKHMGDECRTLIGEAPLLNAEPKRAPDYEGDGEYRHVDVSEYESAPRVDKDLAAYLAGPWFGPRIREDFSDWRKIWTANYNAHVNMRCTLDEIAPHCYVSRRDNHYKQYGWKPYEERDAGPNLKAAAAWLTAKRYGYLFVNATRAKPQTGFAARRPDERLHSRGWIVPWNHAQHGSWYAWLKRKGAHNLGVDVITKQRKLAAEIAANSKLNAEVEAAFEAAIRESSSNNDGEINVRTRVAETA